MAVRGLGCGRAAVPADLDVAAGVRCVVELHHVHELATVRAVGRQESPPSGDDLGALLRIATEQDLERDESNRELERGALHAFREYVDEHRSPARPVRAHFSLRGERLVLWYSAEEMLDLRTELGHLQRHFSTRVEVHQLGPRDAAGMLGGCGVCGRTLCCASWLKQFQGITLRMAREQDLSLMPAAVNGMCGCLKCCLRYEVDQYRDAAAGMPPAGARVQWHDGEGFVVARDILAHRVTVKAEGRFLQLSAQEVVVVPSAGPREGRPMGVGGERRGRP